MASTLPARAITGLYGPKPSIQISYPHAAQEPWTWTAEASNSTMAPKLASCITNGESATEVKFAAQGSKVLAIIGHSALIINYAPGRHKDKSLEYGVCLEGNLGNAHTLELLPDNVLAIATTGQQSDAGVWIYDSASKADDPSPIQKVTGVRAIHGMLWDNEHRTLWVAGTTDAADGTGGTAYGIIQGYEYRNKTLLESFNYTMASASQLASEWKTYAKWWDGPHDLVPVPSGRMVLMPTDQDIYALDLSTGEFNSSGEQLVNEYLGGFHSVDGDRVGYDGVSRPRSDIKSVSLYRAGAAVGALYTQAQWRDEAAIPKQVNFLDANGALSVMYKGQRVYRSRWFEEVDGWRTA
ncbi:hypothetical protein VFPPC_06140 [Pochonia chlamydosporia 170]|uniref:Uncharacterized protein n=1 Tax=Pochonia chlamydosporia 170 TaxID=1380566 RepID=A0A179FI97_METCM|nr:hypothetical protein VFPPC_06140 [Pochonia chlamydosporia 170]OAQ64961.1 hypothetical protein VFPPC_06140 [Pochonia chlamydosporia 170]